MNRLNVALIATVFFSILAAGCTTTERTGHARPAIAGAANTPLTPEKRKELDDGYRASLLRLFDAAEGSTDLVYDAPGILIFPRLISDGLFEGGQHGEGELRINGVVSGYYRTTTRSIGHEIGAKSKSLVILFMTQDALNRFVTGHGWAAGIDPSVKVMSLGADSGNGPDVAPADIMAFMMAGNELMVDATLKNATVAKIE